MFLKKTKLRLIFILRTPENLKTVAISSFLKLLESLGPSLHPNFTLVELVAYVLKC